VWRGGEGRRAIYRRGKAVSQPRRALSCLPVNGGSAGRSKRLKALPATRRERQRRCGRDSLSSDVVAGERSGAR
jgi:hypothetical protein